MVFYPQVLADIEAEKKQWAVSHSREIEAARLETAGLRQLVKMKTRELRQIKQLSQIILDQRSEVCYRLDQRYVIG